jgi:predicted transcriptional regulator
MSIDQIAAALRVLREHRMGELDVLILHTVGQASEEESTIMNVINKCTTASRQTVHKRIQWLCKKGMLKKVEHPTSMRFKRLVFGAAYLPVVAALRVA